MLLSSELTRAARTPGLGEYGFGWQITRAFGRTYENHNGLIRGFSSQIGYYPDEDLLIVVLTNRVWDDNARTLACDLAAIYFDDTEHLAIDPRRIHGSADPDPSRFAGVYDTVTDGDREVSFEDGRLIWRSSGGQFELIPAGPSTFFPSGQPSIAVRFSETDDSGATFSARRCGNEFLAGSRRSPD